MLEKKDLKYIGMIFLLVVLFFLIGSIIESYGKQQKDAFKPYGEYAELMNAFHGAVNQTIQFNSDDERIAILDIDEYVSDTLVELSYLRFNVEDSGKSGADEMIDLIDWTIGYLDTMSKEKTQKVSYEQRLEAYETMMKMADRARINLVESESLNFSEAWSTLARCHGLFDACAQGGMK